MMPGSPCVPCPGVPAAGAGGEAARGAVSGGAADLALDQVLGDQPALQAGHCAGHEAPEQRG